MTPLRSLTLAVLVAAPLATTACGSDAKKATTATATAAPPATAPPAATAAPPIPFPSGPPTGKLIVRDLRRGHGPAIRAGQTATVNYVGASLSDRRVFDSSYERGQTFPFTLGAGQVIPGWDRGVVGMRAGGRRMLVIPPALAYGAAGSGPIKPNATLVFVIDLVSISG